MFLIETKNKSNDVLHLYKNTYTEFVVKQKKYKLEIELLKQKKHELEVANKTIVALNKYQIENKIIFLKSKLNNRIS